MLSWLAFISIIDAQSDIAVRSPDASVAPSVTLLRGPKPPRIIANAAKTMMNFLITELFYHAYAFVSAS